MLVVVSLLNRSRQDRWRVMLLPWGTPPVTSASNNLSYKFAAGYSTTQSLTPQSSI